MNMTEKWILATLKWMKREQIEELFEQKLFVDKLEYFFTEVDRQLPLEAKQ